ncbi:MAG: restriction endonuclease subunit S [Methanosarcina sp.]
MKLLVTIEEACELVTDGTHYTPKNAGIGIPFLTVKDVTDLELDFINCSFITPEDYIAARDGKSAPQKDDVLFSKDGTVGKVHVVTTDRQFAVLSSLAILRPKKNMVDTTYFGHVLRSPIVLEDALKRKTGSAIRRIVLSDLKKVKIPLPSLDEQNKIADVLGRAESLRAKRRAALAKLDELVQSIFIEMFGDPATNPKGWPICNIGNLLESASYGTSEKSEATGDYPVLRMNNITRTGEMDLTDLKFMDLADSQKERYLVKAGDVFFNRTNSAELVGKTAIFRDARQMAYAGYLIRLRVNSQNDPEYLSAFLNTDYSKRMLRGMCKSIIGMANINATEIQAMKIPQPPLYLQQEFTRRLLIIERLKATHKASLAKLDELFASLQYRAFRGEL